MIAARGYRPGARLQMSGGRDMNRRSLPIQLSRTYHPRVRVESDKFKKQISASAHSIMDRRWTPTSPARCHPCTPCISVNRTIQIHLDIFDLQRCTSLLPFHFSFILYQCLRESGDAPNPQHGWIDFISGKNKQGLVSTPGNGFHPWPAISRRCKPCIPQCCTFQSHVNSSCRHRSIVFSFRLPWDLLPFKSVS